MSDDGSVGSGCSGEGTTVADLLLNAADDRSFGKLAHREDISDTEGSLLSAVDEGTSVEALGSDKGLFAELVTVWVAEDDAGKRSAARRLTNFSNSLLNTQQDIPARIVDNFLHDTANVTVPFGVVEGA